MRSLSLKKFLLLLCIIKFILPFLLYNSYYQLHRDEYLYLSEGHHLAWGYLEVPPMLALFGWLSNLSGGGFFWVKLWPNLFGVFTMLLCGNMIITLGGKKFALLLGLLPLMIGGFLRLFYLLHPNFLDVFFWTLMAYSIFYFVHTSENKWLYLFGLAVGLGMMSKYSSAFYAASLLIGLCISRHRKVFTNKHLYLAGLLAVGVFSPNIYWQYSHNFPIIFHMKELEDTQLQFITPAAFIFSQVMMMLVFIFIWISGLLFVIISRQGSNYRLFGWAYVAVIAILFYFHGKDYYALGTYPILFVLGGYYLEKITAKSFRWTRVLMVAVPVTLSILIMPLIMPVAKPAALAAYYQRHDIKKTGALNWEDQQDHELPQDFADMIGWREMTEKAAKVFYALPPEEQKKTMIYARGYYTAGALNYYGPAFHLPTVYSDNASFLFWMPEKYQLQNLLLVGHNIPDHDDKVFQQFEKMTVLDSVNMPMFRENGMKFILFENGNDSVNAMIEKGIAEMKAKYTRQ